VENWVSPSGSETTSCEIEKHSLLLFRQECF